MHSIDSVRPQGLRRRGPALELALLRAAWDELKATGYGGMTFEGVASRAETSRPVVSRRWSTKDAMARDAITWASDQFVLVDHDTSSVRDDTIDLLEQLNDAFVDFAAAMTAQLAGFFEDTGTDPASLRESLIAKRWPLIESVACRAAERGEIDGTKLTPRILRLPFDLLRHEALMTVRHVPTDVIREIVDTIYLPLITPSTTDPTRRQAPQSRKRESESETSYRRA